MTREALLIVAAMFVVAAASWRGVHGQENALVFRMNADSGQAVVDEQAGTVIILDRHKLRTMDLESKAVKESHELGELRQLMVCTGLTASGKHCFLDDGDGITVFETAGFAKVASVERRSITDASSNVAGDLSAQTRLSHDSRFLISNDTTSNTLFKVAIYPEPKLIASFDVRADDVSNFVVSSGEYPLIGAVSYAKARRGMRYELYLLDFGLGELATLDLPNLTSVLCIKSERDRNPLVALGSGFEWMVLELASDGLKTQARGAHRLQPSRLGVTSGAISPNREYLVTGVDGQPVKSFWSLPSGEKLGDLRTGQGIRIDFSETGRYVVFCDRREVHVYDVARLVKGFSSNR